MAVTRPLGQGSASHWYTPSFPSSTCNKSYAIALMRAGIIAVILLGVLAFLILT
ncbi:MAG: hypothetical protein U0S13_06405 [Mycobacterium sp.]